MEFNRKKTCRCRHLGGSEDVGSGAAEILDIAKDSGHLGTRRSAEVEEEGKIEKKRGIRFVVGRRGTTQRCQCHGSQKTASHPIGSAGTPRPNITPVTVRAKKKDAGMESCFPPRRRHSNVCFYAPRHTASTRSDTKTRAPRRGLCSLRT